MSTLCLPHELRARVEAEARKAFPRECCGLLEGKREDARWLVSAVHPARNLSTAPDRFEVDPASHFRLLRELRGTDRAVIGCYHSHPYGRAVPSPGDRESIADQDFLWLIAAMPQDGACELAAFDRRGNGFNPVTVL